MRGQGTSDGISSKDWEIVADLAARIANAACAENERAGNAATQELFAHLVRLERKYGRLPSILATRADYAEDMSQKVSLLEEAWRLAQNRQDIRNLVFIASSLAEVFLTELKDYQKGRKWLGELEIALGNHWGDDEYAQVIELREELRKGVASRR